MNYYDEEISINGPDSKNLSHFKMDRIPSNSSGRGAAANRTATLRQSKNVSFRFICCY